MIIPVVLYYLIFCYYPMYGAQIAFRNYSPKKGITGSPWAGLKHFAEFFKSVYFGRLIGNTLSINLKNLIFGFPAPIIFALLLNEMRWTKCKRVVQTVSYMPHFISTVVIAGMVLQFTATDGFITHSTALNILATCVAAYVLSRKQFMLRRFFTLMFIFTMYFSGGLIPSYLLIKDLGLINSRLALILPGAVSTFNLMIMITGFEGIPQSLEESARIDGAGDLTIMFRIVMPLAKPTIMVILLYYAVGHWNSWFHAMIYLRDADKMPLQIFLRDILTRSQLGAMTGQTDIEDVGLTDNQIRYDHRIYGADSLYLPFHTEAFCQGCHDRGRQRIMPSIL